MKTDEQQLQEFLNMFGNAAKIVITGMGSSATMHLVIDGVPLKCVITKDVEEYKGDITVKDGDPFKGIDMESAKGRN